MSWNKQHVSYTLDFFLSNYEGSFFLISNILLSKEIIKLIYMYSHTAVIKDIISLSGFKFVVIFLIVII